jgi:hypothetical protein
MSASDRRLILLADRFPDVSRMTRFRIEQEPDFPTPVIIRNRKYYDSDELTAWEESRRRVGKTTPKRAAEAEADV